MAYAIEYHVGRKFGGWKMGDKRFLAAEAARQEIADLTRGCMVANATCITARVVSTGEPS